MKLEGKKELTARSLKVGKNRIVFNTARLNEIKEAITKQDIKDLHAGGAIIIIDKKGRRKKEKRKTRKRAGSIKKKVKSGKTNYVVLARKLRNYLQFLKSRDKISKEIYLQLRREIRTGRFKSLAQMKERISEVTK